MMLAGAAGDCLVVSMMAELDRDGGCGLLTPTRDVRRVGRAGFILPVDRLTSCFPATYNEHYSYFLLPFWGG